MGRGSGKVTMKQIQNEKVRKSAFIQRNKGLTKKVSDFSKNFGVEACLIVYDGDGDGKPMTWPQDSETLQSILTKYEHQKIETTQKEFNVKDYFANKKNKVEVEILRVRKKIMMDKYPTWSRCFNNMGTKQLKDFMDIVDLKIQACNQRINMLKNMQQNDQTSFMQNIAQMQSVVPKNVATPQSSQLNDPTNPLIDISEMIDLTNIIEWGGLMPQKNVFSSNSSQLDVMHSIPQMQHDNISLALVSSSTSQLGEFGKLDDLVDKSDQNQLSNFNGWVKQRDNISLAPVSSSTSQLGEFGKLDDLVDKSNQNQLSDFNGWVKQHDNISLAPVSSSTSQLDEFEKLDDLVDKSDQNQLSNFNDWVKQHDVFERKNISFLLEIEQQCAALDAFHPQPRYGF